MSEIKYNIVSSGSKGNAVILNDEILVDCGVPFKAIAPFIKPLKLVLLTHIHGDHFNVATIKRLSAERPALRFVCGTWLALPLSKAGVPVRNIDIVESGNVYAYKSASIVPFLLYHDVPNMGYKIAIADGDNVAKAFYATDAGHLNGIFAKNFDLYLVEGNYDDEELQQRIDEKKADQKFVYERRAKEFHLSKNQCVDFFLRNAGANSKFVYLHEHGKE